MMDGKTQSNFLGPKAENMNILKHFIEIVLEHHSNWRKSFYPEDPMLLENSHSEIKHLESRLLDLLKRSEKGLPTFHPRYSAQMTKDPSIPAILGYLTFIMTNPNNHAYEGGPVTTEMELEVIEMLKRMLGFEQGWGHLTSGGSLANTEALWAARDYYGKGPVYFSSVSHYSWKRICKILAIDDHHEIPADKDFRIELELLEDKIKNNGAMFVVANIGSTGTGSIDNIKEILKLKEKYSFHLHLDAAYGGFFRSMLLDARDNIMRQDECQDISEYTYEQLSLISEADSITIDPHKHGLAPYGAGAVIFKDEGLRQAILNTAPYTYHKQDKPNIGMFSLEGSRPGASAAACYLSFLSLPLNSTGIGSLIQKSVSAANMFFKSIDDSELYFNINTPDLDINCFSRNSEEASVHILNAFNTSIYNNMSVETEAPEFILSKFILPPSLTRKVLPSIEIKQDEDLITLRSVFMKPWHSERDFTYIKKLIEKLNMEC